MSKKRITDLDHLPEVFVSDKGLSAVVSRALKTGLLRKIGSRLYTKNLTGEPAEIVKRNWHVLLKDYFPGALISDRTALENGPAADGSVFFISPKIRKEIVLPGITYKPRRGSPPLKNDLPFLDGLRLSSAPRAWLENMRSSRSRSGSAPRTLSKEQLEERLEHILRHSGETALNRLRDESRAVSQQLHLEKEFKEFDEMVGTFLGTRDAKFTSSIGKARKQGSPYDPDRLELFMVLFKELNSSSPNVRSAAHMNDAAKVHLAFFEAYFSNYIEGTEFPVEEAIDIVFNGNIPKDRPADAHDVLGTYRIISNQSEMSRIPRNFDDFVSLLRNRHAAVMEMRAEKGPGQFKAKVNQAGSTVFVAPDLVPGTLQKGFEIYRGISAPLHRAIFMMFLVSEVHPFVDGNGRIARIMMNAELVAEGEQKIIIPTVFRTDYLVALKALSQSANATPIIRVLNFAQKYTASISWENFDAARAVLQQTNAFVDAREAEDKGIRLRLPKDSILASE